MSESTKRAIDDAIAAHLADAEGMILTGWLVMAKGKRQDQIGTPITRYVGLSSDNLEYHGALGLAHYAVLDIESDYNDDPEV